MQLNGWFDTDAFVFTFFENIFKIGWIEETLNKHSASFVGSKFHINLDHRKYNIVIWQSLWRIIFETGLALHKQYI